MRCTKCGGALLREKLVALASKRLIIVADDTKLVDTLGKFRLSIEVVSFAWQHTHSNIRLKTIQTNITIHKL
ncbi:ribose-5-phosphate isomerase A [Metabacillus sp. FJAT-53654]|uniref:ribose-5-phosphate isomerase n=2 Tax=Metabacillus TaxID=2675233 RepID=A0ABX6SAY4_9BACI|nr:ribose-5-phosphate isomerase A [Metabacillus sp. KUDC1714]QNF31119.1 ribose-5-phosphate isomerase A [Metabacillus sp. KUDC1714]